MPRFGAGSGADDDRSGVIIRLSRSADNGFCAASKSVSGDGHTSDLANQIFILGHGEWDVCEGGHWLDVMKNRWPIKNSPHAVAPADNSQLALTPDFVN